MNWIIENWFLLVAFAACAGVAAYAVVRFSGLPTEKQKEKIKNWLIWACIEAEKELQSGTGQLKLRDVWNKFCAIPAFTAIAKFISFDTFSGYVKEALTMAKEMLVKNRSLATYVYGDAANEEVDKLRKQLNGRTSV